ncbi:MAG: hypothetical protein OFPI_15870 [Osedax symbiont Rs2]|nr:MAG: hypothetical protein OFPI_15870 [Osedax symbiont Rs2]
MDTSKIATTNQKLLSIKLHLQHSQQVLAEGDHPSLQQTFNQAISFHFQLAYVAFLQEVATDYQIGSADVASFAQLEQQLEKRDIVSQECSMLAELECDSSSWLSVMLRSYQNCWPAGFSANGKVKLDPVANSLIQFSDVSEHYSSAQYQHSYQQLYSLVQRYRDLMQEW